MIIGHLKFFAAVQVRHVDLFEAAAAIGDIGDPGVKDARSAGELIDDLIDELVRDAPKVPNPSGLTFTDPLLILVDVK